MNYYLQMNASLLKSSVLQSSIKNKRFPILIFVKQLTIVTATNNAKIFVFYVLMTLQNLIIRNMTLCLQYSS
jgi:hypothetical protein